MEGRGRPTYYDIAQVFKTTNPTWSRIGLFSFGFKVMKLSTLRYHVKNRNTKQGSSVTVTKVLVKSKGPSTTSQANCKHSLLLTAGNSQLAHTHTLGQHLRFSTAVARTTSYGLEPSGNKFHMFPNYSSLAKTLGHTSHYNRLTETWEMEGAAKRKVPSGLKTSAGLRKTPENTLYATKTR